jgi:nucleotide-binding universal stress UspA family protein
MPNLLLVPLDGSATADAALPHAVELARRMSCGIVLVRVHQPMAAIAGPPEVGPIFPDPAVEEEVRADAERWLDQCAVDLRQTSGLFVRTEFRVGPLAESIVDVAADLAAVAIVCCTHNHTGWAPDWFGSVTDAVVRHSPCPVIAMSEAGAARPMRMARLLVLTDGSELADEVVPYAMWYTRAFGGEMELMQVVTPPWAGDGVVMATEVSQDAFGVDVVAARAKEALDDLCAQLHTSGIRARSIVQVDTNPARAILEYIAASDPDACAISTHGRGLSRLLLGSIADRVLREGGRPTLIVPPGVRAPAPKEVGAHIGDDPLIDD